ncbi:relaxase/mobilization nuclease domain-containing protein [Kitasatospora gansuensis]
MIGNITRGRKAYGGLLYDHGPGRRDEHVDPRIIAGSVPGTWQQVARQIDHHTGQKPHLTEPIWRVSLSLPDEDGVLADARFAAIAEEYVSRMGFAACPWVAVRHGDDHIHITVSRLGWDGRQVTNGRDKLRNRAACDALEIKHRLVRAESRFKAVPGVRSGNELAAARARGAAPPEREQIRALVSAARDAAAGRGRAHFEQLLAEAGVDFKANVASTGRMSGYSFSLPSWVKPDGEQVWVTASKTGRDLAWAKLGPVLEPVSVAPPGQVEALLVDDDSATAAPVSKPPPDLARLRLAEARERAEDQRAEVVHTLGTIPAGTVADLVAALRTVRTTLDTREKKLAAETATAMRLDGLVSGVSVGMNRAELHQELAGLRLAVGLEAEAAGLTTAAGQQRQQAAAARRVEEESTAAAGSKWKTGRSKRSAEGMAAAAAEMAGRSEAEALRLEGLAEQAKARAREAAPEVRGGYAEALAELEGRWPEAERAAIREDAQRARFAQIEQQVPLHELRVSVGKARRGVEQLLAEQARRAALPPERLQLEDAVRADLAREVMARAARSGSTTARPSKKTAPKKPRPRGSASSSRRTCAGATTPATGATPRAGRWSPRLVKTLEAQVTVRSTNALTCGFQGWKPGRPAPGRPPGASAVRVDSLVRHGPRRTGRDGREPARGDEARRRGELGVLDVPGAGPLRAPEHRLRPARRGTTRSVSTASASR